MPRTPEEPGPEPGRREGAPHPREAPAFFGQEAAEAEVLAAWAARRLQSGWLLAGPEGVGKATFAYRLATALLARRDAPQTLDMAPEDPDARLVRAGSHPRLLVLRRGLDDRGNLRAVITVDEARALRDFFGLSAADGGRRVVIVDAADDLNPNAANAILKLLEEPPAGAHLLLVAHQPSRLLPTIRSRCRLLRLQPLAAPDLARALGSIGLAPEEPEAVAALAGGSAGAAVRLAGGDGLTLYRELVALLAGLPRLDRPAALALAESCAGRGADERFDLLLDLLDALLARLARAGAGGVPPPAAPGEAALLARLAPGSGAARAFASFQQEASARARRGRAVNLDPASLILDMLLALEETARRAAAA